VSLVTTLCHARSIAPELQEASASEFDPPQLWRTSVFLRSGHSPLGPRTTDIGRVPPEAERRFVGLNT